MDKHHHTKGNITVVENNQTIPFDIQRIYYLYDIPGGESRGGHAHKELRQLIVAASGSFTVTLDDGKVRRSFVLNRPYQGLLVVPGIWRTLDDFSSGAVCLVLASHAYDVPGGESRGGHAYRENEEFIVALSGSFDVVLDDGNNKKVFSLNRSYYGLYVPKGLWREMNNFSTNSLALILSSTVYEEKDYIRDYNEFLKTKHK